MARVLFLVMVIALVGLSIGGCGASDTGQDADRAPDEGGAAPTSDVNPATVPPVASPLTEVEEATVETIQAQPEQTPEAQEEQSPSDVSPEPLEENATVGQETAEPPLAQEEPDTGATEEIVSLAETEALVKADLAAALSVPVEQIQVVEVITRTWTDPGLGCGSQKGLVQAVPVPGYQIALAYGDEIFRYHTDRQAHFVRCLGPGKPLGPIMGGKQ